MGIEMPVRAEKASSADEMGDIERLIDARAYRQAVALCAREHGPAIGRLCMAMLGVQAEAEEALQETLVAAHAGMHGYRADGTVRAWLFGIARRTCARRIEARVRRERKLVLVHDADASSPTPADLVEARRRAEIVREALERLKPSEREALLLRYEADLSYREIGHACGLDEATARKRASRALEKLAALLQSKEGTP